MKKHLVTVCGKVGWDRIDRVLASEPGVRWVIVREVEDVPPRGLMDGFDLTLRPVAHYRSQREMGEKSSREEALDVATSIGNAEIAPGVNVRLHLFYKSFSLWWMIEPALRDHLASLIESVRLVRLVVRTEKPDRIYVLGKAPQHIFAAEGTLLNPEVAVAVARQEGIDVVRMRPVTRRRRASIRLALPSFIRFSLWAGSRARRAAYWTSRWFKPVGEERVPDRTIAVVSDHLNWRSAARADKLAGGRNDAIIGNVLRELDADTSSRVLFVDFLSFAGAGLRAIAEKVSRFAQIEYRPLELYVGRQVLKNVWMHSHLSRTKWEELQKSRAVREAASFEGVRLWHATRTKMAFFVLFWLPLGTYYAEAMASFIRGEKPDLLLIVGEQGVYGRCFLAAAQSQGVATLGMQHGAISRDHRQYTHSAGMVAAGGRFVGTTLCPIPDTTAVYGKFFERILVENGGYPEGSVVVTGQPSYDFLYNARDNGARERICSQLDIGRSQDIVVLATQTHRGFTNDQNRRLLEIVFDAIGEFPGKKLVVKLHPAEEPSLHRRIARERGVLDDIVIVKDVNLFDLLRACEMLITAHSTVALEGMLFDKPVVTVNVTGGRDVMPYAESGAAIGVRDAAELTGAMRAVFTDDELQKKLQDGRKKFIADCLYPLDGRAARRVADLALSMADAHAKKRDKEQNS